METVGAAATGPRAMNELLLTFNAANIRYLLVGGQAMRLAGLPRFSMDWDFFIPPRDDVNFSKLNEILNGELDVPLIPLGARGENFIQTYQTRWGVLQFHLGLPGVPVNCLSGKLLLASKRAADRPQDQVDIEFLEELKRLGKLS